MFDLKIDPKLPHHYIIGVAMHPMKSSMPGKMFLKYGPVYFTNKDVAQVSDSLTLINDEIYTKIYNMSPSEIYIMTDCSELVMSMIGLKIAAQANQATIHHFSSEWEVKESENFFDGLVSRANKKDSRERKQLDDSIIRQM